MQSSTSPTPKACGTIDGSRRGVLARPGLCAGIGAGAAVGVFLWLAAYVLGFGVIPELRWLDAEWWAAPAAALLGGAVGATRGRCVLVAAGALAALLIVAVTASPVTGALLPGVIRIDPLRKAAGIVVLTGEVRDDGEPGADTAQRLMHAYELLRAGYADVLVVTRQAPPKPSHRAMVEKHMRRLGFRWALLEPERPVRNTHDEALAVAELARKQGWSDVLLVTQPTHSRRAAAVFEHAGVRVISSPCPEERYDLRAPRTPSARLAAFEDLLRELVGTEVYRLRGWI